MKLVASMRRRLIGVPFLRSMPRHTGPSLTGVWKPFQFKLRDVECSASRFHPARLPPMKVSLDHLDVLEPLSKSLQEATKAIANLEVETKGLKHSKAMLNCYFKKEAVCSNRIEGNTMTFHDFLMSGNAAVLSNNSTRQQEVREIVDTIGVIKVGIRQCSLPILQFYTPSSR